MTVLPISAVHAIVESERAGASAWADRHGWNVDVRVEELRLRASTDHPTLHVPVEFVAHLDGYRALPPAWHVVVPGTDTDAGRDHFPQAGPGTSIFHSNLVICAPWNRLAYQSVNAAGPHADWGGPEAWLTVGPPNTTAHTLGDMLAEINRFLSVSPGMMQ